MISHRGAETQRTQFLKAIPLCLCVSVAFLFPALLQATTVSGSVLDAAGTPIASGRIILRLSQEGTVGDPALLLIQPPVSCAITNGSIAGGCEVRGNDTISPARPSFSGLLSNAIPRNASYSNVHAYTCVSANAKPRERPRPPKRPPNRSTRPPCR